MPKSSSKQKAETIVEIDEESMSSDGDSEALADENEPNTEISKTKVTGKELAPASRKTVSQEQSSHVENDSFDVILPPLLGSGNSGECTVMIEVDPEDAALLDYEGISGAIGRFEADDRGVVLDLKGCQYQGSLLPGPTALVVGLSKGGQLRVEGITDEFVTFVKTQDVMAKLDAVVEGEMDEGFRVQDENVNSLKGHTTESGENKSNNGKTSNSTTKRAASSTPSKLVTKKRKSASKKTPQFN